MKTLLVISSLLMVGCGADALPLSPTRLPETRIPSMTSPIQGTDCSHIDTTTYSGWLEHERCLNR